MAGKGKYYESQFEEATIKLLQESHWQYTFGDDIHRKYTDPLIEQDLREFLSAQYKDRQLTVPEIDGIVANLRNISGTNDYYALQEAFLLYRDGYNFTYNDGRGQPFRLEYIDFEHPDHNIFRCVNQFVMEQGQENRRPDILLFINGIPVCIIELKNPTNQNATIRDAHTQICTRYMRDIPALLKYCALAVISDGAKNALGTTYTPFEFFYEWKKIDNADKAGKGLDTLRTLIRGALSPERILEIIRDYVYFPDPSREEDTTEIICRYPQFFATRKLRDNILLHLRSANNGDGKGGTYFGATGCGKTYTMLFLARQLALRCREQLGSPTILIIVDREDLETQSAKLFCRSKRYLEDEAVKIFETRRELAEEMRMRKTGGVYITTIQKFAESTGLLTDRFNVICMSDEAHRTQNNLGTRMSIRTEVKPDEIGAKITYGFAKYLRDALPNATYVGFTGTPIDETIHVFGDIVDQYTMKQAEADGITVPILYDPRLARVFLDGKQAEKVEDYYKTCAEEGATPEDIAKSKEAMSSMEVIIGDEDVLRRVARDIIDDYKRRTAPTDRLQKAMITCANRPIAFKLYKIMREIQPDWFEKKKALNEWTLTTEEREKLHDIAFVNMVMTRDKNDEKELYDLLGDKEYRKFLDTEFKSGKSNFHISINVDMWITGFDVPCLTMLYNDKPLSKHTLIQTISRVNRKFGTKENGFIIDYIGIREEMKKEMKKYGGDEYDGGEKAEEDIAVAHNILRQELRTLQGSFSELKFDRFFKGTNLDRLQFLQEASEYILAHNTKEEGKISFLCLFRGHVKKLRSAFNICNPAGCLTDDETMWSQCFMGICSYTNKITATEHDTEAMNKDVEKMVREAITANGVERVVSDEIMDENIFGEDFLKELENVKMPFTKFQILCKIAAQAIREYSRTNKLRAEHFNEMLKKTIEAYNKRDKLPFANESAKDVIENVSNIVVNEIDKLSDKLIGLLKELHTDSKKFKELGITFEEKAFYDVLVETRNRHGFEYADEHCITLAKKIKGLIDDTAVYADWLNNDNLKYRLSFQLTILLHHEGYPPEWDEEVFQKVLEQVENYKNNE
ncbi:MAG: HsdR family type I site-specific deoxyribonuclease [Porphyromonadaceae bacterium]|nr:HsdR family type I site-specific deoxyribonuclease [Porphyromonadaceae bacterium]